MNRKVNTILCPIPSIQNHTILSLNKPEEEEEEEEEETLFVNGMDNNIA